MGALGDTGEMHAIGLDLAILLRHHGVGARRQRRAGEDAHGMTGRQLLVGGITGSDAPGEWQPAAFSRQVGGAQGVAVHCAVVPGRHREGRV